MNNIDLTNEFKEMSIGEQMNIEGGNPLLAWLAKPIVTYAIKTVVYAASAAAGYWITDKIIK
ncbi:hypothetical protein QTL86_17715 [Cellulosilyticum sp. ST5]|uniref:hypothetical protein n=1 Tax=unclassified Cellulosilyticum TaxID=2643091 RepID=UPI000F8D28C9|nr:hypothetical protein [Cellulosilyticum sp. WCF-2]QEH67511.1 hypothetical protein EKH84_03435 [Cellulosilyticum sp. WCF-2]